MKCILRTLIVLIMVAGIMGVFADEVNAEMPEDLSAYVRGFSYFHPDGTMLLPWGDMSLKISSADELVQRYASLSHSPFAPPSLMVNEIFLNPRFDESFFEDNFLLFLKTANDMGMVHRRFLSATGTSGVINYEIGLWWTYMPSPGIEFIYTVLEIDRSLVDWGTSVSITRHILPITPTVMGTPSANSITLNTRGNTEHRIVSPYYGTWQTSPVFSDLSPDTEYLFESRFLETSWPGFYTESSFSEVVRTAPEPPCFGDVPVTGIPNITGYIVALCVSIVLAVSGAYFLIASKFQRLDKGRACHR